MKSASRILLLISGILSIVAAVLYLIFGILMLAMTGESGKAAMQEAINNGTVTVASGLTQEEAIAALQGMALAVGVVFMFLVVFCIINSVLSFKARNHQTKGLLILNIVFGALSGVLLNILGGIFGLVSRSNE